MSEDEIVVMIFSVVLTLIFWGYWYAMTSGVYAFTGGHTARRFLFITPLVSTAILYFILRHLASFDVQEDYRYIGMYMFFGLAWVGVSMTPIGSFGISARDDAVERRNVAAAIAISGAILGIFLCFAGGNIGDGPGWWVVLFSAIIATVAFFILWIVFELTTRVSEVITVDRDMSAGLRLAGFLVASGLILGRAVAGDWVSVDATVRDFLAMAWPVVPLLLIAIVIERILRPDADNPVRSTVGAGLFPALAYIMAAGWYVVVWLDRP